jgi:hypothetical protein
LRNDSGVRGRIKNKIPSVADIAGTILNEFLRALIKIEKSRRYKMKKERV